MQQCNENSKPKQDERLAFLADRMAILMAIVKNRFGDDWNPWAGEAMFEDDDSIGEEIRTWPDYKQARAIVERMIEKHDKSNEQE